MVLPLAKVTNKADKQRFSILCNSICNVKQECPYVTKYARIVVHKWNWPHI